MAQQIADPILEVALPRHFNALAPMRHPAYARLRTGAFVSNIGTWMETLALGIYVVLIATRLVRPGITRALDQPVEISVETVLD